jgi:hypothetical protein
LNHIALVPLIFAAIEECKMTEWQDDPGISACPYTLSPPPFDQRW